MPAKQNIYGWDGTNWVPIRVDALGFIQDRGRPPTSRQIYECRWPDVTLEKAVRTEFTFLGAFVRSTDYVWILSHQQRVDSSVKLEVEDSWTWDLWNMLTLATAYEGHGLNYDPACPMRLPASFAAGHRLRMWFDAGNAYATTMILFETSLVNKANHLSNPAITFPVGAAIRVRGNILVHPAEYDEFTDNSGVETEVLRCDLGAEYTAEIVGGRMKAFIDVAQAGSFVKVYISPTTVAWEKIFDSGDLPVVGDPEDEKTFHPLANNKTLRYLSWRVNSADAARTATLRLFSHFVQV